MAYLTYSEYISLGGTASETAFSSYVDIIENKLDYITNGRIHLLEDVPSEVKILCVKLVDVCCEPEVNRDPALTSYSNGIESFGYNVTDVKGSTSIDDRLVAIIKEWLWKYPELLYRGRKQWKQNQ